MTRCRSLLILLLALALAVPLACVGTAHAAGKSGPRTAGGWKVTPAGKQFGVSRRATGFQGPLASALSPGGSKLLSLSSGASRSNSADLFDMGTRKRSSYIRYDARRGIGEAVFYGVAMSPDGSRAWASGGGQDVVHSYAVGPSLREVGTIPVPNFPAGIAYGDTPRGPRLYVVNNSPASRSAIRPGRQVSVIDPAAGTVTGRIDLGVAAQPLGVAFARDRPDGDRQQLAWPQVSVIDTQTEKKLASSPVSLAADPLVADHPSAVAANPQRDEAYVANANSDTVSVLDSRTGAVQATIASALVPDGPKGATPDGLAVAPDGASSTSRSRARTRSPSSTSTHAPCAASSRRRGIRPTSR